MREIMTPVMQTKYLPEHGKGNCMQAAVASFLNYDLTEVPDFVNDTSNAKEAYGLFFKFFQDIGLGLLRLDPHRYAPKCIYFVIGTTHRNTTHMCLFEEGNLLHDPHPDKSGLVSQDVMYVPVMVDVSKWNFKGE